MLKQFYLSPKLRIIRQIIKFGVVGTTNVVLDMVIYYILTRYFDLHYLIAATISFVIVVTWSFNFNRKWTFKLQNSFKKLKTQYVEFVLVNILVLILNVAVLYLLVDLFSIFDLISKVIASIVIGLINFFINKFWTFREFDKQL